MAGYRRFRRGRSSEIPVAFSRREPASKSPEVALTAADMNFHTAMREGRREVTGECMALVTSLRLIEAAKEAEIEG
ncbi:MAG: hypothetical protein JWN34_710 [Bryobacterales bacterium]|nr:hypothetical protein [Bryobacterales bacterium]